MKKPWYIRRKTWDRELRHGQIREGLKDGTINVLDYLYDRLSILDTKVALLLTVNSVLLTAVSIGASQISDLFGARLVFAVAALLWLVSTLICLGISFLKWEHMHNATSSLVHYRHKIVKVTIRRSSAYNVAVALILVVVFGVGLWAYMGLLLKPGRPDKVTQSDVSLTLLLQHDQTISQASHPDYAFERIGCIGPFRAGEDQITDGQTTTGYMTAQEVLRQLMLGASNKGDLVFVVLVGKVDKRELTTRAYKRYGSNLTLAQKRASWVKRVLNADPILHVPKDKVLAIVSGADVVDQMGRDDDVLQTDRVVDCYAIFRRASQKLP